MRSLNVDVAYDVDDVAHVAVVDANAILVALAPPLAASRPRPYRLAPAHPRPGGRCNTFFRS